MKFLFILSATLLVSCSTTQNINQKSGNLKINLATDLHADLEVDTAKKITGKAHHIRILGIYTKSSSHFADGITYNASNENGAFSIFGPGMEETTKSAAAYNATVPSKADIIVAPQYHIKVKSYLFGAYKEVSAQVSGYAAKIKDIKQIKK
jgi:hypothetical protein